MGPVVPNVDTARQVAEAVIATRQDRQTREHFVLRIGREREGQDWTAIQHPRADDDRPGASGLRFRISYCTGGVTDIEDAS